MALEDLTARSIVLKRMENIHIIGHLVKGITSRQEQTQGKHESTKIQALVLLFFTKDDFLDFFKQSRLASLLGFLVSK